MHTTARAITVKLKLDLAPLAGVVVPNGQARVAITVDAIGRTFHAELNARSVRRVIRSIATQEPGAVVCFLKGRLNAADVITEAGIMVAPKDPPAVQAAAA